MTWKWIVLVIVAVLVSSWMMYGILHAINGIAYEFEILVNAIRGD